jgi:hypothetical protein
MCVGHRGRAVRRPIVLLELAFSAVVADQVRGFEVTVLRSGNPCAFRSASRCACSSLREPGQFPKNQAIFEKVLTCR